MPPRNSVTAQERTMLLAQLATITAQGQQGNHWHCTQSGCDYRSKIPEWVQAHFQETHMPSGQTAIRLLCDRPPCPIVSHTAKSWSSHKSLVHTGTAATRNAAQTGTAAQAGPAAPTGNVAQSAPQPPVRAAVVVPVPTPLPAIAATPTAPTSLAQPMPSRVEHDDENSDTADDHDMDSDAEPDVRIRDNINASMEAIQLSNTSSSSQTDSGLRVNANHNPSASHPDTRYTASRTAVSPQVEQFLDNLCETPDQLRKSQDLHSTLQQVFSGGSFIHLNRFRDDISHSEPCPRYRCFILASTIMWLTRTEVNQSLRRRLQLHARIARPTNAPDDVLVYQHHADSAFYDFLYGLYFRGKFDPSGYSWFTDGRLVDVVGYVATEQEVDDIERYCKMGKKMKEHMDSQGINREGYMRDT